MTQLVALAERARIVRRHAKVAVGDQIGAAWDWNAPRYAFAFKSNHTLHDRAA